MSLEDHFGRLIMQDDLVSKAHDRADRTQAAFKKVNNEMKRLKSQFSNVKRENEILKQVKDTLSKRLQLEEQKNLQLAKDYQKSRRDSANTSQYEGEIRELRTKLAIAEAEREAAQTLANIRLQHEKKFFLSVEETVELYFRWVLLYWYWSLADRLSVCSEVAAMNASFWGSHIKGVPILDSDHLLVKNVAALLQYPSQDREEEEVEEEEKKKKKMTNDKDNHAGPSSGFAIEHMGQRRFTLHDLLHAEMSLRGVYEMDLDSSVHSLLVERSRAKILPLLCDLADPSTSHSLHTLPLSLDPSNDTSLTFTHDFVVWIQLSRLWLGYIWGKASENKIEPHIADSRCDYWRERSQGEITSRDIVDTQKAMQELHTLQIENQLWIARSKSGIVR